MSQYDYDPRCCKCNRKLAGMVTRPWKIRCQRCKADNARGEIYPEYRQTLTERLVKK